MFARRLRKRLNLFLRRRRALALFIMSAVAVGLFYLVAIGTFSPAATAATSEPEGAREAPADPAGPGSERGEAQLGEPAAAPPPPAPRRADTEKLRAEVHALAEDKQRLQEEVLRLQSELQKRVQEEQAQGAQGKPPAAQQERRGRQPPAAAPPQKGAGIPQQQQQQPPQQQQFPPQQQQQQRPPPQQFQQHAGQQTHQQIPPQQQQQLQQQQQQPQGLGLGGDVEIPPPPALAPRVFPPPGPDAERMQAVRDGFLHAWRGYEKFAWGRDEVRPVSKQGGDDFGGTGATLVDSLDTLWIMGLKDEFEAARNWVADHLTWHDKGDVSFFETTIRCLGGLLAAYDLSGDAVFLEKARQLGDRLMPAFGTPTGIPHSTVNLGSGVAHSPAWAAGSATLAEVATVQLEFTQLSHHTGDPKYAKAANAVIAHLERLNVPDGLYGMFLDTNSGHFTNDFVTLGARGDSAYEYFLKMWVLSGRAPEAGMFRRLYDKSMDGVARRLIQRSSPSRLLYIAEMDQSKNLVHKMDHLTCFVPAMLALGATGATEELHMQMARELMVTCVEMYRRQPTGLAPELVKFQPGQDFSTDSWHNLLRPETVESLFYLWRYTHDPQYREWGWEIFQAFERHARTEIAYSGIRDVRRVPPVLDDRMESFFMAETMKYLYLLFCDDDVIPLDKYVFNTEAHPLLIHAPPPPAAPGLGPAAPLQ